MTTLHRWDFESDATGWITEQDQAYKPWSACAHTRSGFLGSRGALQVTGVSHWGSVGALTTCSFPGTGTKVTWAYRARACTAIMVQGQVPAMKKQLHGTTTTFRNDAWTVATSDVERWNHWDGGDLIGKGQDFSTLMVFANSAGAESELTIDDVVIWQGIDRTPPDRVRSASASIDDATGEVVLSWLPPPDNVAVASLVVHRSLAAEGTIGQGTRLGETSDTGFRDATISNFGTYHYRFVAIDACGNESEPSAPLAITVSER
ncbi:MAG: hypothetical protein H0V44_05735 [Planctomycetes bacterium]|nr:hypothetical protein [Planctomycetota bacterium]